MKSIHKNTATIAIALMGLSSPAFAQAICGGDGDGGVWIAGDEASSDISNTATYQEQLALVLAGNAHIALFSVSAATNVRVEAQGSGAGDPMISLLDGNGDTVLSDDDSGGDGASFAEASLEPGTYCLRTSSFEGSALTATVRIGRTEHEQLTSGAIVIDDGGIQVPSRALPAEGCQTGIALGGNTEINMGIRQTNFIDETSYYTFSLDAPLAISITAENSDLDPMIRLYDSTFTQLSDYDWLNARLDIASPLEPDEYCIGIFALSDASLPTAISISAYDPEAALLSRIANGEDSPPLDGSYPVEMLGELKALHSADIEISSEASWFTLDISEPGLLLVEAISEAGDPWVVVFDDTGRKAGYNDDNLDSLDSLVAVRVTPGTYSIGIGELDDEVISPARVTFERFVPTR